MIPDLVPLDHPELPRLVEAALETGQILVFPTETIYGIGGNPWDVGVVERVRKLKGRSAKQPFTLHLHATSAIPTLARVGSETQARIDRLLPGPYTLLLHATSAAPPSAVLDGVVGVRVPDHSFFSKTLSELKRPIFGTSVNRTGEAPLTDVNEIIERFPSVDLIVVGGVGSRPSAILDLTVEPPRVLRGDPPETL